jgi:hypothetical protein
VGSYGQRLRMTEYISSLNVTGNRYHNTPLRFRRIRCGFLSRSHRNVEGIQTVHLEKLSRSGRGLFYISVSISDYAESNCGMIDELESICKEAVIA